MLVIKNIVAEMKNALNGLTRRHDMAGKEFLSLRISQLKPLELKQAEKKKKTEKIRKRTEYPIAVRQLQKV